MIKKVVYHDKARKALEKGIDILSQAIGVTLGPKGKNVVLGCKLGLPQIINDGATIAKEIELSDSLENTGVALIRQAALKTNDVAGDGTTTSIVLAHAIIKKGMKSIAAGSNPLVLKKGIEQAVKFIVNKLSEYSRPVQNIDDIIKIASISSGNDLEVGSIVACAIEKVGREGVISFEESQSVGFALEVTEGIRFNKGFISPYFLNDLSSIEIFQDNPYILLTDRKISVVQKELIPMLEQVSKTNRPLLIIAEDVEKEALATLILNKLKGIVNVVAVRAPGFADRRKVFLEDLAILTGGQVISEDMGLSLEEVSLNMMGSAKHVTISKSYTTIIAHDNKNAVELHCSNIRQQIETINNSYEKEKLQERLSKLSCGVAVIKLGAATDVEIKDKRLRLEDAINATKAAIEEGIIPGGGATLVHLSQEMSIWANEFLSSEELVGALIVEQALCMPLLKIVQNTGLNGLVILEKIKKACFEIGYDANNGTIADMYTSGIIDPTKVTRSALQNAASIASIIMTTECIIVDRLKE